MLPYPKFQSLQSLIFPIALALSCQTPSRLARSPCMIATTSRIGVVFVGFPPTSRAGSRGAEPVSVDSDVALPTLPPPYPDHVPSALPLPAWDTTASGNRFNAVSLGIY